MTYYEMGWNAFKKNAPNRLSKMAARIVGLEFVPNGLNIEPPSNLDNLQVKEWAMGYTTAFWDSLRKARGVKW